MMFNMLSLSFQSTRQAQTEIAWIRKKAGIDPGAFTDEKIRQRCKELDIPMEISETVRRNIAFLQSIMPETDEDAGEN